jgi:hypothetical protein
LPAIRIDTPDYDRAIWGTIVAMLLTLVGICSKLYPLTLIGIPLAGFCFLLTVIAATQIAAGVEFGELRTFRDLAVAMARSESA